jgi:polyisoprenoid-binding protein YceI
MGHYTPLPGLCQGGGPKERPMMRRPATRSLLVLLASLLASAALAQGVATNPGLAPAGRYRVVRDHTQVVFAAMHLGLSPYYGRIGGATGTLTFTPLDPARSTILIELDTRSLSTMSDAVSRAWCADDAFACAKAPRIAFRSTAIKRTGDTTGEITGNLTLGGVTKPVTLKAQFHGGTQGPLGQDNYQLGFSAEGTIKRSDFGLTKMIWTSTVSDDVTLFIAAEFEQDRG